MSEIYSILFFEASSDTTIHSSSCSVTIKAGEMSQVTNDVWRDTADEARSVALAELSRLHVEGSGAWFVGVFEADKDGNDKELLWEKAA